MKNWKKITAVIVVILLAYLYAHVSKTHEIYDKHLDSSEYVEIGISQVPVECQFVSNENTLDAVRVKCRVYVEEPKGITWVELWDVEKNEVVAKTSLNTEEIQTGKFNDFSFERINGCRNRTYKVILRSDEAGFFCQEDGTLIMKTVTERFDIETFCIVLLFITYIGLFFKFLYRLFSR